MAVEITPLTLVRRRMTGIDAAAADTGRSRGHRCRHGRIRGPAARPDITDAQQIEFTRNFGRCRTAPAPPSDATAAARSAFADVSNIGKDGRMLSRDDRRRMASLGNRLWHSDASFRVVPARYSLLSGRIVVTEGGNTEFADMRAAYDALDPQTKADIEDMVCEHSQIFSREQLGFTGFLPEERARMKPVRHRLVRTHPMSGRKSIFLSAHIGGIVGWPMPEARAFIRDLMEHATQAQFVYAHRWTQHDLVIWDNRTTMHRVRRYDDLAMVRDLRRTTTKCDGPTAAQEAA